MKSSKNIRALLICWLVSFALLLLYAYGLLVGYEHKGRPLIEIMI